MTSTRFYLWSCSPSCSRSCLRAYSYSYRRSGSERGFTLIEVILALGLTAMLLGLLSSGMYIVAEDWNRESSVLDQRLDEALVLLQIDRALQGAFPHSYTNDDTLSRQLYFLGEEDRLGFVSTVSPQRSPGMTAWQLSSVEDEGIFVAIAPAFADNPAARLEARDPELILPGYSISFAYLYEEYADVHSWREDWYADEVLQLPLAVYARLTPFDDNEAVLEIVAPIRATDHRSIQPNTAAIDAL